MHCSRKSLIAICALAAALHCQTAKASDEAATSTAIASVPKANLSVSQIGDNAWAQLLVAIQAPRSNTKENSSPELQVADQAKDFYTRFPQHPRAKEARKFEAISLVSAVANGDTTLAARMESTVKAVRNDNTLSKFDRAVVVGTYEFTLAPKHITSREDMMREFEAIARRLIAEFPDQPQGYVSLVSQAMQCDNNHARQLTTEVINSPAPEDVKSGARCLMARLNLVGTPVQDILKDTLATNGVPAWQASRPGIIYFWAAGNVNSLAVADLFTRYDLTGFNLLAVCLDSNVTAASQVVSARKLPGSVIYAGSDPNGSLATRFEAHEVPLVYFVDASGKISDVRGLNDLEAKLQKLTSK